MRLAVEDDLRLKASEVEFKLPRPSYTIDTLTYLKEKYPQNEFSIIMGSDSFQNLPRWKNFEQLVKNFLFIIYKRPGFEIKENFGAVVNLLDAPLLDISSTRIRLLLKEKKSIRFLVPDVVKEEIEANGYYK